jgi:AcrR family transcriptional regulator
MTEHRFDATPECTSLDTRRAGVQQSRPSDMTTPIDPRVIRTRRQLREALVASILERGWDAVNVKDVCERAEIGRSTFYVHFADKEELLLSGFDELHAALDRERLAVERPFAFVRPLVAHAKDNVRLFRALIGRRSGQAVQRRFYEVVTGLIEADLVRVGIEASHVRWTARYIGGGFVELLMAWLDRPAALDIATLVAMFDRFTRGVLRSAGVKKSTRVG